MKIITAVATFGLVVSYIPQYDSVTGTLMPETYLISDIQENAGYVYLMPGKIIDLELHISGEVVTSTTRIALNSGQKTVEIMQLIIDFVSSFNTMMNDFIRRRKHREAQDASYGDDSPRQATTQLLSSVPARNQNEEEIKSESTILHFEEMKGRVQRSLESGGSNSGSVNDDLDELIKTMNGIGNDLYQVNPNLVGRIYAALNRIQLKLAESKDQPPSKVNKLIDVIGFLDKIREEIKSLNKKPQPNISETINEIITLFNEMIPKEN